MSPAEARTLFLDQLGPNDTLARYGEKAAVAAILAATNQSAEVAERMALAGQREPMGHNYFQRVYRAMRGADTCEYCDGTGDVHRPDGEWLGKCDCVCGMCANAGMNPCCVRCGHTLAAQPATSGSAA